MYWPVRARCRALLHSDHDAEDAAHEVFRRAAERASELEWTRAWLLRVATNVCLDELKRRRREQRAVDREGSSLRVAPSDLAESVVDPSALRRLLARLTTAERAVVERRWLRGVTLEEAAGDLGIASSTAR